VGGVSDPEREADSGDSWDLAPQVALRLLDVSRISDLGWAPAIGLREGITATYEGYRTAR